MLVTRDMLPPEVANISGDVSSTDSFGETDQYWAS